MPESNELLGAYLNDHLAGSTAGLDLARKLAAHNEGTPVGSLLTELASAIEEDRATLEDLMERLGVARSTVKQVQAAAAEKVSRLRFHRRVTGSSDLSRLLEMEALSMGIEGKRLLWLSLKETARERAELASADLDTLADRARRQREDLEPHRRSMAARALVGGQPPTR